MIFPNVRGSTGYGKTVNKLDNGFLRQDSYKDIAALFDWIAARPELDSDRIAVEGGSYGGHMTLAVSTFYNGHRERWPARKNARPTRCPSRGCGIMTTMPSSFSLRWIAVSVFVVSSTLNYLDRQLLNTLAPLIMVEFHLNQLSFGWLISAFSIAYAASTLGAGWVLDRFGVNRGISAAVGWWSAAAMGTGLVRAVPGLIACRAALGVGESAGVPAVGKLNGIYLQPEERALGAAVNQIGLSLGAALAPLWIGVAAVAGWRVPFMMMGLCGFIWVPIWLLVSNKIPARYRDSERVAAGGPGFALLLDRNLLLLVAANVLWMGGYSLWSNWTTLYLIHVHGLTLRETARYVWIPPLVSNLGGFFGGWLSYRWIRRAMDAVRARRRAIWIGAAGSLVTLFIPLAGSAAVTTALISVSFFFALAGSVNLYALPIDLFTPRRAGMAIAALTCSYGLLQTVISPVIGFLSDHKLYMGVLWMVTLPLFLSALVLNLIRPAIEDATQVS